MIFIGIIELPGVDDLDFGFIFILFSENWFDADNDINKSLRKKISLAPVSNVTDFDFGLLLKISLLRNVQQLGIC